MQYVFSLDYNQLSIPNRRHLRNAVARLRRAVASGLCSVTGKDSGKDAVKQLLVKWPVRLSLT